MLFIGGCVVMPLLHTQTTIPPFRGDRQKHPKENYTWHHVDDFKPKSGTCSMQLVQKEAHEATYTHKGSCAQYDEYHNEKIYNK